MVFVALKIEEKVKIEVPVKSSTPKTVQAQSKCPDCFHSAILA
jgi:hypothetical protein